jgi:hypothetical protein
MENDKENLIAEILKMPELEMTSALFSLNANSPAKAEIFFFALIHASGARAHSIIPFIPSLHTPQLQALLENHRNFSQHFPQFEGNFALGVFMQENRAHPPPVGQPPVCPEAVKEILSIITSAIAAVRIIQAKDLAEEAFFAYQITAYLLAKLKQFKVNEGYINSTSIPLFTNQHSQLKRAFERFTEKIPFPAEPFDFNNQDFLKRIRPPASRAPPQ